MLKQGTSSIGSLEIGVPEPNIIVEPTAVISRLYILGAFLLLELVTLLKNSCASSKIIVRLTIVSSDGRPLSISRRPNCSNIL